MTAAAFDLSAMLHWGGGMPPDAALTPGVVAILALVAGLAGLIDAIAGGGGLLVLPALLLAGFDPASALGINKLQGSFSTGSATLTFARARMIDWRSGAPMAASAFAGSLLGAAMVGIAPIALLKTAMPILLVAIALYMAVSPRLTDEDRHRRMPVALFTLSVPPLVGLYDGIFGPGAGSFYMLAFVTLLGFGVIRATAHAKLLNCASNLGALAVLAAIQPIAWPLGLLMGCCALAGAQLGSRLAIRQGVRLIRPLLVVVSCAMAVRLMADPTNPLRAAVLDALQFMPPKN